MKTLIHLLADATILIVLLGGVYALVWKLRGPRRELYPYVLMAGLTSLLVAKATSVFYQPETARPFLQAHATAGALYVDNPGFPSDHALLATVITLAVFSVTKSRRLAFILAITTIVMSTARVVAQVHTPLDVTGGIIFGLVGGLWYIMLHDAPVDDIGRHTHRKTAGS